MPRRSPRSTSPRRTFRASPRSRARVGDVTTAKAGGLTPRLLEWATENPQAWRMSDEWYKANRPLARRSPPVLGKKKKPRRSSNVDWIQRFLNFIRSDDEELVVVTI